MAQNKLKKSVFPFIIIKVELLKIFDKINSTLFSYILFYQASEYWTILSAIQMPFEYWTTIGRLNSIQVQVCYSDVSAIQMFTIQIPTEHFLC